ncbi:hypothetical protein BZG36_00631 [Bifiguratus adelaidae]|uniref:Uncharacterized protein n=1 Tax=Bifiguratus adelaidae TaxID=1938954 RepID=A0A261Y7A8_9FUNG|nr:hypothetical protein BZG36_00631 [Bifiguratus adelaidae]
MSAIWCYQKEGKWEPFSAKNQARIDRKAQEGWGYVDLVEPQAFGEDALSIVFDCSMNGRPSFSGTMETIQQGSLRVQKLIKHYQQVVSDHGLRGVAEA